MLLRERRRRRCPKNLLVTGPMGGPWINHMWAAGRCGGALCSVLGEVLACTDACLIDTCMLRAASGNVTLKCDMHSQARPCLTKHWMAAPVLCECEIRSFTFIARALLLRAGGLSKRCRPVTRIQKHFHNPGGAAKFPAYRMTCLLTFSSCPPLLCRPATRREPLSS